MLDLAPYSCQLLLHLDEVIVRPEGSMPLRHTTTTPKTEFKNRIHRAPIKTPTNKRVFQHPMSYNLLHSLRASSSHPLSGDCRELHKNPATARVDALCVVQKVLIASRRHSMTSASTSSTNSINVKMVGEERKTEKLLLPGPWLCSRSPVRSSRSPPRLRAPRLECTAEVCSKAARSSCGVQSCRGGRGSD